MSRYSCLEHLLKFDRPLDEIRAELKTYGWDSDAELVTLTRSDVKNTLLRFLCGELRSTDVENWANAIEGRDDIGFEMGCAELLLEAIFALANPTINEEITPDACRQWLVRLAVRSK